MTESDQAYQDALDYLYRFVDYSLTRNLRYSADKFDLSRMVDLMARLDNPHHQYPVIHIAGTKGKGSIAALIANALKAAGYRTGLYTSPHLQDFTERIQVNNQQIPQNDLVTLLEEIKPHAAQIPRITTFELTTALGFLYFARQKVDVAVVEVGLGGRLDATNVVDPSVAIISSLSLDHMAVLGDTLAKIAVEKAGIFKPGRPVVLAPQREDAQRVIERIAKERNAPLVQVGRDYHFAPWRHSLDSQTLLVWPASEQALADEFIESGGRVDWEPLRLTIPLLGYHQVENAATAYTGLQVARQQGLAVSDEAILKGFASVSWPGRFEVMQRTPPVIVDSAHNQDSALRLRLALDDYFPGQPVILVFGASEDKDIHGMFTELLPRVSRVVATHSEHPRAINADKLVELAHQFGCSAQAITPVEKALAWAMETAGHAPHPAIVVAGSLFVAAAAREAWPRLVKSQSLEKIL